MDLLETARLLRFQTEWERRWHYYETLLTAGLDAEEAQRIIDDVEADRAEEEFRHAA